MSVAKFTVSVDEKLVQKLDRLVNEKIFSSRSQAIQVSVGEKIARMERGRLAAECAKLDSAEEITMAEEEMAADREQWPEY